MPLRPDREPRVVEYAIDNEALIYHESLQTIVHLNRTAAAVWRHCDGRSIEQIAHALSAAFDVPFPQALDDTTGVVKQLLAGRLLVTEAGHAVEE